MKVTNVATGVVSSSVSSSSGEFLFQDLPLGIYSAEISAGGFGKTKYDKIQVAAGTMYTLPVKLAVASESLTVEVNAAAIALDTTTVTQTTVLDQKAVDNMPLNGRDFTQLVQLTPGFAGYVGGGFGSLNGTRANQMNWQIDGVDNNDLWHNVPAVNQGGVSGIAGIVLPIDAVDQFSAQTQAGPEGGRNPGGTVNLSLKAGSNSLHGSVYYFNRNELFGTKSPFADIKQKVRNYNTGFSVGGPFLKDKLFGFLSFEHQRFVIGESGTATEPNTGWQTQAKALLAMNGLASLGVMQSTLNTLYTSGNLGSTDTTPDNFHSPVPEYGYSWNGIGKLDWHISDKDSLSAHWFTGQGNQVAPVGSQLADYYEVAPLHVHNIAIVYNRSITPHISNQVLMGVNYFNQVFNDANTNFGSIQTAGFVTSAKYTNAPNINIGSFDPAGLTPPEGRNDITGHLTDQVSWIIGNHELRFGGEFRQAQLDEFYKRHSVGSFTFDGSQIAQTINAKLPGCATTPQTATNCYTPDQYIAPLADFLSGRTSDATIAIGDPERQVFVNTWFLSAGDSWKVTPKLVLNYGARFDYVGPLHNGLQDLSVFRPGLTPSGIAFQGNQIDSLYQKYYGAFSPRLGLNYSLSNTTVLRAGYGFYYDTPNLNPFLDNRPGNAAPNGVEGNPVGPNPVFTIDVGEVQIAQGQNIFGTSTGVSCTTAAPCGVFSINKNFRPSVNQNYSLNVEQTLAPGVIAQVGYVGSQARHLLALLDINQALPGVYANNSARQVTRPYFSLYPQYGNINEVQSIGTSNYNSLQTQLRVNNWHRISASGTYTWSHNLDETSQYRGELPQDSRNFKGQYGNSDYDVRNTFVMFASYELPGSNYLKMLTSGWQVNALASYHGGQPFNIAASGNVSGTNEGTDRAVQILPDPYAGFRQRKTGASWLNPAAFSDAPQGTFGTLRRNQFYGPGYGDMDLSFFKNTRIAERVNIQFRAELFNLGNRINFAPPSSNNSGGTFTLNDTIGDYNGAPGIGAGEPFNTQFGAKITF
ncbi:TonB-dependent receptor [Terriglobus roseus]|uniref:Carboxypeptidase regulatory-like domain-containing protein n=1 Tax=Terriglobus roseus TaxID=392734 RepID=A0A1H4PI93_9BACT|nr:TonB-dependent receptor [Terriglobus roseus]SEC07070.1 Carboxypeptidase regulatory-like domain-containing protein [Terriglobus roseus]